MNPISEVVWAYLQKSNNKYISSSQWQIIYLSVVRTQSQLTQNKTIYWHISKTIQNNTLGHNTVQYNTIEKVENEWFTKSYYGQTTGGMVDHPVVHGIKWLMQHLSIL